MPLQLVERVVDRMVMRVGYGGEVSRGRAGAPIAGTQRRPPPLPLPGQGSAAGAGLPGGLGALLAS